MEPTPNQPQLTQNPVTPQPSPQSSNSGNRTIQILTIAVILLLLSGLGVAAFMFVNKPTRSVATNPAVQQPIEAGPSENQVVCTMDAKVCPDGSTVGRVGPNCEFAPCPSVTPESQEGSLQTYTDPKAIFTVGYLDSYKAQFVDDLSAISLIKYGPTQTLGTELYDGVSVTIEVVELSGRNLEQLVDMEMQQSQDMGLGEVVSAKQATTLNNYQGFTYTFEGLGTYEYKYIQKDANSPYVVKITKMLVDPSGAGFEAEVQLMLDSIQILK